MKSTSNNELGYQELKLKVSQGIYLTQENLQDLAIINTIPDMGWNYDTETGHTNFVETVEVQMENHTYTLRVNLSWGMITLLEVN